MVLVLLNLYENFFSADMVSQMPKPEWKALLSQARKEAATSTDRKSQTAVTLLEENCEDDHIQTLKTISDSHCPGDMTNPEKFRMSILILHKLGNAIFTSSGIKKIKSIVSIVSLHPSMNNS